MSDPQSPDARAAGLVHPRRGRSLALRSRPGLRRRDGIFDYIDGAGEVYRSYNMRLLVARRFHKDGQPDIVVDAFDMGSSEDAFGVFTHDLDGEERGDRPGLGLQGRAAVVLEGPLFPVRLRRGGDGRRRRPSSSTSAVASPRPSRERERRPACSRSCRPRELDARRVRFFHRHSVLNYHYFVADDEHPPPRPDDGRRPGGLRRRGRGDDPAPRRGLCRRPRRHRRGPRVVRSGLHARCAGRRDDRQDGEREMDGRSGSGAEILAVVFDAPTERRARDLLESVLLSPGAAARARPIDS
ncbi:MAG: hypothetical protein M0C28_38210 [Candidatus Moduliflexus flocculans]|nr:hypothetical protein [Candidatus Moduliflexus flocculans]